MLWHSVPVVEKVPSPPATKKSVASCLFRAIVPLRNGTTREFEIDAVTMTRNPLPMDVGIDPAPEEVMDGVLVVGLINSLDVKA